MDKSHHKKHRDPYDLATIKDKPVELSIIVVIKNRTRFEVSYKGTKLTLELFRHNLEALKDLHLAGEQWELVVVDFDSSDVDMAQFLKEQFSQAKPGFSYQLVRPKYPYFNLGMGRNIGVQAAKYSSLLVLDADMILQSRELILVGNHFVRQNKVFFPICNHYRNPDHTNHIPRPTATGIVYMKRKQLTKYNLKWSAPKGWGHEDGHFYYACCRKGLCARAIVPSLFHQWHPHSRSWKNRFTEQGAKQKVRAEAKARVKAASEKVKQEQEQEKQKEKKPMQEQEKQKEKKPIQEQEKQKEKKPIQEKQKQKQKRKEKEKKEKEKKDEKKEEKGTGKSKDKKTKAKPKPVAKASSKRRRRLKRVRRFTRSAS